MLILDILLCRRKVHDKIHAFLTLYALGRFPNSYAYYGKKALEYIIFSHISLVVLKVFSDFHIF